MLRHILLIIIMLLLIPGANAQLSIEKRIERIERKQRALEQNQSNLYKRFVEGTGVVSTYLSEKVLFGGYFETGITHLYGESMETQTSANSHVLGLNITAEFSEKIRFSSQVLTGLAYSLLNAHNNPNISPAQRKFATPVYGSILAQAYTEYIFDTYLNIQLGLGYVPFGYSFQVREPLLLRRRGGAQMTNAASATTPGIAFPLWMGLHVHGNFIKDHTRWGYNLYTFSPNTNPGTLGLGARLWSEPSAPLTIGISAQSGQQGSDTYYSYGLDLNLKYRRAGILSEFATVSMISGSSAPQSYYIEPYAFIDDGSHFLLYLAADYLNSPNSVNSASLIADPFQKWAWGAGINWLPLSFTRVRLGYLMHDYIGQTETINGQARDYSSVDLSVSAAF